MRIHRAKKNKKVRRAVELPDLSGDRAENGAATLSDDLAENRKNLELIFNRCSDFVLRTVCADGEPKILLAYLDGLIDVRTLETVLLKPFTGERFAGLLEEGHPPGERVGRQLIAAVPVRTAATVKEVADGILSAHVAVIVNGEAKASVADLKGYEQRALEEPTTEKVIRGPKEGFNESLRTNTSLLRRRIRSSRLKMETVSVGTISKTDVVFTYIEGIATERLVAEVRERIGRIRVDGVTDSACIEEFVEDAPYSPFPQVLSTERPDIVTAGLLEGRVAILSDNTPFALVVPMTFWSGLHAAEDYYERFVYVTFIRALRFILFNVSLFLPSLYVALTTFHPELIPTDLLVSIAAAREGIPFPAVVEALLMEFVFEALREAGVRLPRAVGSAVSIVGALVIGQAAVQAGIVSAPMIIVVAATGIASFVIPRYSFGLGVRLIRFILLILAGVLGLYGIVIGFIALSIHLVNLHAFGTPYFGPVAPRNSAISKDFIFRAPRWAQIARRANPDTAQERSGS